jgi:methyltransferase FkbM-like protein
MAASDQPGIAGMQIPRFETGLNNYYEAKLSKGMADFHVLTVKVNALAFPHPIKLMKIDAEGHDPAVLRGPNHYWRDHPILIVEMAQAMSPNTPEDLDTRLTECQVVQTRFFVGFQDKQ